MIKKHVEVS